MLASLEWLKMACWLWLTVAVLPWVAGYGLERLGVAGNMVEWRIVSDSWVSAWLAGYILGFLTGFLIN